MRSYTKKKNRQRTVKQSFIPPLKIGKRWKPGSGRSVTETTLTHPPKACLPSSIASASLENDTEEGWHKHMETENDDFPLTIPMERIWEWFYSYKRLYELNYKRLTTLIYDIRNQENTILKRSVCLTPIHGVLQEIS